MILFIFFIVFLFKDLDLFELEVRLELFEFFFFDFFCLSLDFFELLFFCILDFKEFFIVMKWLFLGNIFYENMYGCKEI